MKKIITAIAIFISTNILAQKVAESRTNQPIKDTTIATDSLYNKLLAAHRKYDYIINNKINLSIAEFKNLDTAIKRNRFYLNNLFINYDSFSLGDKDSINTIVSDYIVKADLLEKKGRFQKTSSELKPLAKKEINSFANLRRHSTFLAGDIDPVTRCKIKVEVEVAPPEIKKDIIIYYLPKKWIISTAYETLGFRKLFYNNWKDIDKHIDKFMQFAKSCNCNGIIEDVAMGDACMVIYNKVKKELVDAVTDFSIQPSYGESTVIFKHPITN
jgi:hypothetical protein